MTIKPNHTIYGPDIQPIIFNHARIRNQYNGSDLLDLRSGGYDWYLYQQPEFDPETQKLDGVKRIEGVYVTEGVIDIPEPELAQREIVKIDSELIALDAKATRGVEDLVVNLVSLGKIPAIPPELSSTVIKKNELRAARLVLTDGIVTEQEAIGLGTTKTGFWAWLGGLFT